MTDIRRGPIHLQGDHPLGGRRCIAPITPAVYQEDPLFLAWCEALDELLVPLAAGLDCFPAYLDPRLAPPDFLRWLGGLLGLDDEELIEPLRARVAGAVADHRRSGTVGGLRTTVARAAGVPVERVEVSEPGAVVWSTAPGAAVPAAAPAVRIVIRSPEAGPEAAQAALAAARRCVPVQYQAQLEVVVESR